MLVGKLPRVLNVLLMSVFGDDALDETCDVNDFLLIPNLMLFFRPASVALLVNFYYSAPVEF